jgi:hypothetical protein
MHKQFSAIVSAVLLSACMTGAQGSKQSQSIPGMDMSGHDMSKMPADSSGMKDMPGWMPSRAHPPCILWKGITWTWART